MRVEIGPPLRRFCNGREELSGEGSNVLEVLLDLSADYPALRSRILKNETEISSLIFVYRGDGTIIMQDREAAPVDENTTLRLYLFVAGG